MEILNFSIPDRLVANKINDVDAALLLDRNSNVHIFGSIRTDRLFVRGGISAKSLDCDLGEVLYDLHHPGSKRFRTVTASSARVGENAGSLSVVLNNLLSYNISRPIFGKVRTWGGPG